MSSSIHDADDSSPDKDLLAEPSIAPLEQYLADEKATESFGAILAPVIEPGLIIWLSGDLGAGKTTLTRGLLRALGHTGSVKSPTYTLLEPYVVSRIALYHFDFYRFNSPDEFIDAGLEEYFSDNGATAGVCLVEWAEKARPYVPLPDLDIQLAVRAPGRQIRCTAQTEQGTQCLKKLKKTEPEK